ncbi:MAG: zeta toxin family protein [Desulfatibacillaceae bacterium]|nr:zeta toxin family protein [Desulfatibacillaceae bacterium]
MNQQDKAQDTDGAGKNPVVIISGSYGSGKTEYAVNLAAKSVDDGKPCMLVDLDVVKPYFRSRDVREEFEKRGIAVVAPEGHFSHADLPMLSPRVGGAIRQKERPVILDAGGDPAGARVLGRFCSEIKARGYEMALVVNTRRPDTRTLDDTLIMMGMIEAKSGLLFTGIVANTHLMEQTDTALVLEGVKAARQVADKTGVAFETALVLEDNLARVDISKVDAPVFVLKKHLKKPWEHQTEAPYRI